MINVAYSQVLGYNWPTDVSIKFFVINSKLLAAHMFLAPGIITARGGRNNPESMVQHM